MKYYYLFLVLYEFAFVSSPIPNWDFYSHAINLLDSSSSFSYEIYNKEYDGKTAKLFKEITRENNEIISKNKLKVDTTTIEVPFEDIDGHFQNRYGSSVLICPKGKFHPFDFYNKVNKLILILENRGIGI